MVGDPPSSPSPSSSRVRWGIQRAFRCKLYPDKASLSRPAERSHGYVSCFIRSNNGFVCPGLYVESAVAQEYGLLGRRTRLTNRNVQGEGTEGDWDFNVTFTFYRGLKKVEGRGSYNVYLDTDITTVTGDLSLYKVSSNVMNEVKGHNGQLQNTGSMETCNAQFGKYTNLTWDPRELTSLNPDEFSSDLTIACTGAFCDDERIRAGYKPSLSVELNANSEDIPMTFDGSFSPWMDKDYFRDNVRHPSSSPTREI